MLRAAGLLIVALAGFSGQAAAAEPADTGASGWQDLIRELETRRREAAVPAMGVVILDQGQPVVIRGLGSAASDTPFRWGSITKSFTALAALQLVNAGRLTLESRVRDVLDEAYYQNPWADPHPLRLVDLLELAAGLTDLSGAEFDDNRVLSLEQALARGADQRRTLWPPGLQHSYSNVPPGLTAAVIEAAASEGFEPFLTRQVLKPLTMSRASLQPIPGLPGGFKADGETRIPYWNMTYRAFGALNAPLDEMARFATALLNEGRLPGGQALPGHQALPAPVVAQFFRPTATLGARAGLEITYAAGSYGWVRDGHQFWGHGGDADGYLSRYGLLRDHGRGYLLVINTDNPSLMGSLRRTIESALIRDLPAHSSPAATETPDADQAALDALIGTYYPASVRFGRARWQQGQASTAAVVREGKGLRFQRGRRDIRLIPVGPGRFIRPGDPAVTVVFARDAAGAIYLQGELGNFVNLSQGACPGFIAACN